METTRQKFTRYVTAFLLDMRSHNNAVIRYTDIMRLIRKHNLAYLSMEALISNGVINRTSKKGRYLVLFDINDSMVDGIVEEKMKKQVPPYDEAPIDYQIKIDSLTAGLEALSSRVEKHIGINNERFNALYKFIETMKIAMLEQDKPEIIDLQRIIDQLSMEQDKLRSRIFVIEHILDQHVFKKPAWFKYFKWPKWKIRFKPDTLPFTKLETGLFIAIIVLIIVLFTFIEPYIKNLF